MKESLKFKTDVRKLCKARWN